MGHVVRFPVRKQDLTRAIERLTAELERDRTVVDAFDAADRGDFNAAPILEVMRGHAGTWEDFFALSERITLVARAMRACGGPVGI